MSIKTGACVATSALLWDSDIWKPTNDLLKRGALTGLDTKRGGATLTVMKIKVAERQLRESVWRRLWQDSGAGQLLVFGLGVPVLTAVLAWFAVEQGWFFEPIALRDEQLWIALPVVAFIAMCVPYMWYVYGRAMQNQRNEARAEVERLLRRPHAIIGELRSSKPFRFWNTESIQLFRFVRDNAAHFRRGMTSHLEITQLVGPYVQASEQPEDGLPTHHIKNSAASFFRDQLIGIGLSQNLTTAEEPPSLQAMAVEQSTSSCNQILAHQCPHRTNEQSSANHYEVGRAAPSRFTGKADCGSWT